ncbi:unnamed protein product, partial [Prorocentrum cordatum]
VDYCMQCWDKALAKSFNACAKAARRGLFVGCTLRAMQCRVYDGVIVLHMPGRALRGKLGRAVLSSARHVGPTSRAASLLR